MNRYMRIIVLLVAVVLSTFTCVKLGWRGLGLHYLDHYMANWPSDFGQIDYIELTCITIGA